MRLFFASTCLTPIALLALAPVHAETLIETRRTTAAATATIKSGAADDIRVTSAGSVVLTAGAAAVTLDSASKVTNEGTLQVTDSDGASGILAVAGGTGTIVNSGTITIDETYAATDADKDGDLDGGFAKGSGRAGIRTAGAFTGSVTNTGPVTVEGNDSAGILLGGPLTGALVNNGSIAITGDRAVGIRTAAVSGSVRLAGTIAAQGRDASAAVIGGDIGGALVVQGALTATGYRSVTLPADVTKLDADDLLQGAPALVVAGNVAGGIVFAVPPRDADPKDLDEDKDGIPDATEGSATVTSYGAAPAVQIGSAARAVAIGAAGSGFGIVVDGSITGTGVYKDVGATGFAIGGLGGSVSVAGGMAVAGTIQATSNNAGATGLRIGSGATLPELRVGGTVAASGGGVAAAQTSAVAIDAGANVQTVRNSGQIRAAAGADGSATAILDRSGTLALVENYGLIAATGAAATSTRNVAIDLRANTGGVTVRQIAGATGAPAPAIVGDVLLGTGNDTLSLAGKSSLTGNVDFGGGTDQLTIAENSILTGTLSRTAGLAVTVTSGTLALTSKGAVGIASLNVGAAGVIGVTIDPASKTSTVFQVAGNASFASGAKVALTLTNVGNAEGSYVIVQAGSLTGAANLTSSAMQLPFLFSSSITSTGTSVAVNLKRKTAVELGLNASQSIAYDPVSKALDGDAKVARAFLDIADAKRFGTQLRQMLPDHAGGTFEAVTQGSRATARLLADPGTPVATRGRVTTWLQQVAWGTTQDLKSTAAYDVNGWGVAGGGELATGAGSFGLSAAFLHGKDADGGTDNEVTTGQYEAAAFWHGNWGGFSANGRASAARVDLRGQRRFSGTIGSETVERSTKGKWDGRLFSASGGVAYELHFGRFSLRPIAAVDYYNLHEGAYAETGGGKAFDLTVASRTSDELALSGTVAAGIDFGRRQAEDSYIRVELEGGRRQIVGGSIGDTTAHFAGGDAFTLRAEDRTNGWVGKLRAVGGNAGFRLAGEVGAEQRQGKAAVAARASVTFAL